MQEKSISSFITLFTLRLLATGKYPDMLVKQNSAHSPSSLIFSALTSSTCGAVTIMQHNFLKFLHFIVILSKLFLMCRIRLKKVFRSHIKEIQAFQKYFETAYRPGDLSRTVREAAVTLKEKFTKKMEISNLLLYVKPEQQYRAAFNMYTPKFP